MKIRARAAAVARVIIVALCLSSAVLAPVYAASPGTADTWNATTALPVGAAVNMSVAYNGYIYDIGGSASGGGVFSTTVNYAPIHSDGTIGTWAATTALPSSRGDATVVVYNGYIYIVGGYNNSGALNTVIYAPINADGTVGSWNTTTALPVTSLFDAGVEAYNGYMYVMGGFPHSGGASSTVYYASISANGTIGNWTTTSSLPVTNGQASSVVYNGYLYILGGVDSNYTATGAVYYAPINADGTVGSWNTTTVLSDNNDQFGATSVVYNGYIYEIAGANGGGSGAMLTGVYSAPIKTDGTLGSWSQTSSLSTGLYQGASAIYNGYAYELGGNDAHGNYLNTVDYAQLTGFPLPTLAIQAPITVDAGKSITINVLNGATGDPDPNSVSIITGPAHGIAVDPPGTITYAANRGYSGSDGFTYQVCSLNDESLCTQATLTLDVAADPTVTAPNTGYGTPHSTNSVVLALGSIDLISIATGLVLLHKKQPTN